jgi:two-component system, OmpR family, phosphate regulon sensor histidine kinase PhoR
MKIPVFARAFTGYLIIIIALSGAGLVAFADTFRDLYRQTLTDNLSNVLVALQPEVTELAKSAPVQLQDYIRRSGDRLKIRITIIDPQGKVLADSMENPQSMENHHNRPEVIEALKGNVGRSTRFSSTTNQESLYVAVPLIYNGSARGAMRANLFLKDVGLPASLKTHMAVIAGILTVIALLAALILSRSISRPIKELTDASHRLAEGDFDSRVFLDRNDEFRVLAETFNTMSRDIKTAFDEATRQRTELKSIIDSLKEGLLVVDKRGDIIYSNESLKEIVGWALITVGKPYWEALGEVRIVEIVEKARSGILDPMEEVEIRGKTFLCSAARLVKEEETVVVLHDISTRKELERIKKELVSSVSHELRTPLTSIKGFAETLEEEVNEEGRHYVEIIKRNTDRLISMVSDLLALSELEEKPSGLEQVDVDLKSLVDDGVRLFTGQARSKGLVIRIEGPPTLPSIIADPFKLEQVITNLLDNAVKYTDEGEIVVSLAHDDRWVTMEVRDTGIGIPRNKLPHIFERFYVVDKSRSRKTGGTGLGLSIVKHIILLHGGDIAVESTQGEGTRFIIKLPLHQG